MVEPVQSRLDQLITVISGNGGVAERQYERKPTAMPQSRAITRRPLTRGDGVVAVRSGAALGARTLAST